MIVLFENVGRAKKTWASTVDAIEGDTLLREVRKHGALGSRDVSFLWDDETSEGVVVVGGFRHVGSFRLVESTNA